VEVLEPETSNGASSRRYSEEGETVRGRKYEVKRGDSQSSLGENRKGVRYDKEENRRSDTNGVTVFFFFERASYIPKVCCTTYFFISALSTCFRFFCCYSVLRLCFLFFVSLC
jgi:hypothetical protein